MIPKLKVVDTVQLLNTALALHKKKKNPREEIILTYPEQGQQFNVFDYSFKKYVFISYANCAKCL